jgi:hypothetical protein
MEPSAKIELCRALSRASMSAEGGTSRPDASSPATLLTTQLERNIPMDLTLIETLGLLAAKAELEAAHVDMPQYGRIHLTSLAERYREAQFVEMRKHAGKLEAA